MKLGIIGSGKLGVALAARLAPQGHEVMLAFSRDPGELAHRAAACRATPGTPGEAVRFGDVVALAVPWAAVDQAMSEAGPLDGKILWDCTNALKADLSGMVFGATFSGGEMIQGLAPRARIVKAIPPFAELLKSSEPRLSGEPSGCFMCGDDAEAKLVVRPLLEALPTTVVDAGPLENARYAEPASFLLVRMAYALGMGPRLGLALQRG